MLKLQKHDDKRLDSVCPLTRGTPVSLLHAVGVTHLVYSRHINGPDRDSHLADKDHCILGFERSSDFAVPRLFWNSFCRISPTNYKIHSHNCVPICDILSFKASEIAHSKSAFRNCQTKYHCDKLNEEWSAVNFSSSPDIGWITRGSARFSNPKSFMEVSQQQGNNLLWLWN